jgi:Uma2 family endonuclease
MTTAEAMPRRLTPEEFLALPDSEAYELIDGELRERNVSAISIWVGNLINFWLTAYARERGGVSFGEGLGLRIFPLRPRHAPRPDGIFVSSGRLKADLPPPTGFLEIAPDLVLEVVSPGDLAVVVKAKIQEYLDAGVRVVWIAYPEAREIEIRRADGTLTILRVGDELTDETVLPGFSVPLLEIFPEGIAERAEEPTT